MLRLMIWDARLMTRSALAPIALGAWVLIVAAAVAFGQTRASRHQTAAEEVDAEAQAKRAQLEQQIVSRELVGLMPVSANGAVVVPPAALLDIVAGRSDLEAMSAEVNIWTLTHLMFLNHQTGNPTALALGAFDLGFVVLYLLPLLLVTLGYSALTQERAQGVERVLLAQGVDSRRLLRARLAARGLLALAPLMAALAVSWLLDPTAHPQRGARLLLVGAAVLVYAAFWQGLVAWVNRRARTDAQALWQLFGAWVVLTLLLPALVGAGARLAYPAPSRFELLAEARRAEIDATRRRDSLLGAYTRENPSAMVTDSATAPLWQKGVVVVTGAVENAVAPVHRRFDEQLLRQQAFSERLQYLSPALIMQRTLVRAAGTDESRFAAVRVQAARYLHELRGAIGDLTMTNQPLTVERLHRLPAFEPVDAPLRDTVRAVASPLAALLLVALLIYRFRNEGSIP